MGVVQRRGLEEGACLPTSMVLKTFIEMGTSTEAIVSFLPSVSMNSCCSKSSH